MKELWDLYDENEHLTGLTMYRGEKRPKGLYNAACAILVKHIDGTYLLMKRSSSKTVWPGIWEASAGGAILSGETPLQGAIRELKEETGIAADTLEEVNVCVLPGSCFFHCYLCSTNIEKTSVTLQPGETEGFQWVTEETLLSMFDNEKGGALMKQRWSAYFESLGKKLRISKYDEASIREDYRYLTQQLIQKGLTITTMESATSGQIASLITDTEGSSAVIKGAFVTYSNEAKILQGVPASVIETYSVYSKETATAMADACQKAYQADIAIGVTGTMGNVDPANKQASVPGQVYFAIKNQGTTHTFHLELSPQSTRLAYKLAVAKEVYDVLISMI